MEIIRVGVSSCLLGHKVRYDGSHKHHSYVAQTLGQYFQFKPFCPEVESNMGVPRPPVQLRVMPNGIRCVGVRDHNRDVTNQLQTIAMEQYDWLGSLCGYILKSDSPSCGMKHVKVYKNDGVPSPTGTGIFAAFLQHTFPNLPIEEEGRLGDPVLRQNFVQRVYVLHRWQQLCKHQLTQQDLMNFHSRHKLIAMSHDQNRAHALGRIIAEVRAETISVVAQNYITALMDCLKIIATRGNHVNVLQHIQGYLKNELNQDDKLELIETIDHYRQARLPLTVPLTLLRHHFHKQFNAFIDGSYYLYPSPGELVFMNEI